MNASLHTCTTIKSSATVHFLNEKREERREKRDKFRWESTNFSLFLNEYCLYSFISVLKMYGSKIKIIFL